MTPSDLQLELEYWAETGEFDEDELHEMKVQDNRIFTIEPKVGKLEPGDTRAVTLTYNHMQPGTDRLPVLLKLAAGREILVSHRFGSFHFHNHVVIFRVISFNHIDFCCAKPRFNNFQ